MRPTHLLLTGAVAWLAWGSSTALAQNSPAGNAPKPAPAAAPTASGGKAPAASAGGNSPAAKGNAPAATGNAPASTGNAPAANGPGKLTVLVPSGGEYTAYLQENPSELKSVKDKAELELPAGATSVTIVVLDSGSGYAARRKVETRSAGELTFGARDFNLLQRVRVQVTGKDDRPIARGSVTLTDGAGAGQVKVIEPDAKGKAEFEMVATGAGKLAVRPAEGSETSKEVTLELPKGETTQVIPVSLPEVTATVEPETPPAAPEPAPAAAPAVAPAVPAPTPAPPAAQQGNDYNWGANLIGFILLAAVLGVAYVVAKNKGITLEVVMKKLGIQPEPVVAGGGSLAGSNLAAGPVAPGAPPPPPPVVADPNQCPFCGQMKNPNGSCACQVVPGQAAGPAFAAAPSGGSGPRLVGMHGTYMGTVFPLHGTVTIGREAANPVPLDRDTTASRRHAQLSVEGGVFRLQDLGSANGTFVNGARVTETVLNPGDEVSIGGTRFRFEV